MRVSIAVACVVVAGAVFAPGSGHRVEAQAQVPHEATAGPPMGAAAQRRDTSRPLRDIPPQPPVSTREDFEVKQAPAEPATPLRVVFSTRGPRGSRLKSPQAIRALSARMGSTSSVVLSRRRKRTPRGLKNDN
jgi:hypothetical protein